MNTGMLGLAVKSLRDRSFRSWITISGIIVSIAVIFILLTLSSGLQLAVVELFEDFGTNRLFILPGQSTSGVGGLEADTFLDKDVDAVSGLSDFEIVIPTVFRFAQKISYRGEDAYGNIQGLPNDDVGMIAEQYQFDENLISGRFFNEGEEGVAVIGYDVAFNTEDFFSRELKIRNVIEINDKRFKVIGVYEETGTSDDSNVYIPFDDARDVLNASNEVDFMDAIVKENSDIEQAKNRVIRLLDRTRGEDTFVVITPEAVITQFNNVIGIVQAILVAIASISLFVGAIGISNTMFTSVLEREKEIGIMKAVGARNRDVLSLFVIESGLIGMIGGSVGLVLGIGVSFLVGVIAAAAGFSLLVIKINLGYVMFCLVFSFVIGVLSGFFPSFLASRKKIVDILRDN